MWDDIACPATGPNPDRTLTVPRGNPHRWNILQNKSAESGVFSDVFRTTTKQKNRGNYIAACASIDDAVRVLMMFSVLGHESANGDAIKVMLITTRFKGLNSRPSFYYSDFRFTDRTPRGSYNSYSDLIIRVLVFRRYVYRSSGLAVWCSCW